MLAALAVLLGVTWTPLDGGGPVWTPKAPVAGGPSGAGDGADEPPAGAPSEPGDEAEEVRRLVLSNIEHALWRESGHMLISELGLPVIGQEEDAADAYAAMMMLSAERSPEERAERLLDVAELMLVSHYLELVANFEELARLAVEQRE